MSPTSPFPLYLLPHLPFRRRSSTQSTSTISNPSSTTSSPSSSPPTPSFLTRTPTSTLRCTKCLADLIPTSCIISKGFTGRHGRAYLVAAPPLSSILHNHGAEHTAGDIPNTHTHRPVPRHLVTGQHTVADISCRCCGSVLGWKYVAAEQEGQRYKVGRFILEAGRVGRWVGGWEGGVDVNSDLDLEDGRGEGCEGEEGRVEEDTQFDSQDEDECEDLFAGVWSPETARKRRSAREFRGR